MRDRDLRTICAKINRDFTTPVTLRYWKTFNYLDLPFPYGGKEGGREYGSVYLPPALVEALGDLTRPLLAQRWVLPPEIIRTVRTLCRASDPKVSTWTYPKTEDLQHFLDWADVAVIEALLDD